MAIKATSSGICIDSFAAAGTKEGRYGVAMIYNPQVCKTAAVFTKSSLKGAHIAVDERRLLTGMQAVIINSGNANAYVEGGEFDAEEMCGIAAKLLGVDKRKVGVASTGITGRKIDLGKIKEVAGKVAPTLRNSAEGSMKAALAIMTTDTKPKMVSFEYKGIKVGAIAKGSGMIAPNMATLLCFVTTNADLPRKELQKALEAGVEESVNMLVIDGDMSPNDTVLLLSDGKKACSRRDFQIILDHTLKEMTKLLAKDGEGAGKFLEVEVRGVATKEKARSAAKAIVSSSLVKSAFCGENPNWGRIIAAVAAKEKIRLVRASLAFESGGLKAYVLKRGKSMSLAKAEKVLKEQDIRVILDLGEGREKATAWGCDLTEEYVQINAEYN